MKKQRIQLIILAVLLIVAAAAFLIMKNRNEAEQASKPLMGKYTAFSIKSDDFKSISVDNHVGDDESVPEMYLEKDGKSWKFVNSDAEVDVMQANQLFSLIISIPSDYELKDVAPGSYGLDDPIRTVITEKDGTEHVLLFGDKNEPIGEYYMLNEDNGNVYLVVSKLFAMMCKSDSTMAKQPAAEDGSAETGSTGE